MKSLLQKLRRQHWETRPQNERRGIAIGALLILPLLAYFLLWQPAHDAVGKLHEQRPKLRIQTEQMRHAAEQVEDMRHQPQLAVMDAAAVKAAVEESLNRHQLRESLTSITAQEPNGVRITLNAVSFETWLSWLRDLQQAQHIRIDSVAVTALSAPGMVTVRAALTNGNNP